MQKCFLLKRLRTYCIIFNCNCYIIINFVCVCFIARKLNTVVAGYFKSNMATQKQNRKCCLAGDYETKEGGCCSQCFYKETNAVYGLHFTKTYDYIHQSLCFVHSAGLVNTGTVLLKLTT